jgi:hypothetical protein
MSGNKSQIPFKQRPVGFFKVAACSIVASIRSYKIILSVIKKKRPSGLFQLAVTPIIVIFINFRRNEVEIILFPAGIAESFFPVWEIDNPIGFADFLIAFWAN